MADKHEPYVGPRPFTQEDKSYFFGRDREANELLSLIIAHPVVLLYAQSGAGKTSLLNASVIPLLEEKSSQVFGPARVSGQIPPEINHEDVSNIYVFHALLSLESDIADQANLTRMSFGEYLKTRPAPPRVAGLSTRRVIIFDQFEEVFTTSPERWNEREAFFDSVGSALEEDPSLRVVFAMREEYLASMDPYVCFLPERLRTRFRLERLRKEPALLAVKKPVEKTERTFAPGAAEKLVESLLKVPIKTASGVVVDVSEEFIEPVQLQVVCQNLWQKLTPEVKVIDEKYIEGYGDVDQALSTYYDNCIARVVEEFQGEITEGELRRWFGRRIITSDGIRGIVYKDDKTKRTGGLLNKVVDRLEDLRLVRPELRGGAAWYELTHDRFISPIRQSNLRWLAARDKGNVTSQSLEARAESWYSAGRQNKDLLQGYDLTEAKDWMKSPYATEIGVSNTLKDFFKASTDREGRTRLRQLLGAAAVLILIAIGYSYYSYSARRQAEDARLIERGQVASTFIKQKKPFDALVWGIKAVEPKVNKGKEPPQEAVDGLREAINLMGNRLWLQGLSTPIDKIEFSPDGKLALAWSQFEGAIWDVATGQLLRKIKADEVTNDLNEGWGQLYFSDDGRFIVADFLPSYLRSKVMTQRESDKKPSIIFVWDAKTGEPKLQGQLEGIRNIAFSPDGTRLLAMDFDGQIRVLNSESGERLATFQFPIKDVDLLRFRGWSRDKRGRLMSFLARGERAVTLVGGVAQVWDTRTGKQDIKFRIGSANTTYYRTFSRDGNHLALVESGGDEESSGIWNLNSGRKVAGFTDVDLFAVGKVDFSPDDKSVALFTVGDSGFNVNYFDVATGNPLPSIQQLVTAGEVVTVGGKVLAVAIQNENDSSTFIVRDAFSGNILAELKGISGKFSSITVSPDLSRVMAYNRDQKDNLAYIWKIGEASFEAKNLSTSQLYSRACNLLRYQHDEYEQVKRECDPHLTK